MAEAIHVGIDYFESISTKRNMLLCEQSILESINHINQYNSLRKKEILLKNKIKKDLSMLRTETEKLESILPRSEELRLEKKSKDMFKEEKIEIKKNPEVKKSKKEKKENQIEEEIEKIKEKLERLNAYQSP